MGGSTGLEYYFYHVKNIHGAPFENTLVFIYGDSELQKYGEAKSSENDCGGVFRFGIQN